MPTPVEFKVTYHNTVSRVNRVFGSTLSTHSAAEQFRALSSQFRRDGSAAYAAFAALAVARCEEAMAQSLPAAVSYSTAGHTFLDLELRAHDCMQLTFREDVLQATQCYLRAIDCYHDRQMYALCASLLMELGAALLKLREHEGAANYLRKAAEMVQADTPLLAAACLQDVIACQLEQGLLQEAVGTAAAVRRLVRPGGPYVPTTRAVADAALTHSMLLVLAGEAQAAAAVAASSFRDPGGPNEDPSERYVVKSTASQNVGPAEGLSLLEGLGAMYLKDAARTANDDPALDDFLFLSDVFISACVESKQQEAVFEAGRELEVYIEDQVQRTLLQMMLRDGTPRLHDAAHV